MKKVFIITCLTTFPFVYGFSQIKVGLKAGFDFGNVKFPAPSDTKTRVAFYGGLKTEIAAGKKFIVQPEILYSQKGFAFSPLGNSKGGHVNINYISVPLLAGYRPADKLTVLAGPEFNYLINAKSHIEEVSSDLSTIYKKFDVGIDLGVAYQLLKSIGIEIRYCYGLSYLAEGTLMDNQGNNIGKIKQGKNRVVQAGLFYIF